MKPIYCQDMDLHNSLEDPCLNSMTFLNDITSHYPDAISFAPGRPIEKDFFIDDIGRYFDLYVENLSQNEKLSNRKIITQLFQYGPSKGFINPLVADMLKETDRIECFPEDIVITSGTQESMVLALRTLYSDNSDVLLVPQPVYVGIIGAAKLLDIRIETFKISDKGIDIDEIKNKIKKIKERGDVVKALYINADYSNPVGVTLACNQKVELIELAENYGFSILEDNPYGIFGSVNIIEPTLFSLDESDRSVIYLGSFSKTLFPGVRIGFIVSKRLSTALTKIKSMLTLNTSPITQAIVGGMLLECRGDLRVFCEEKINFYQHNLKHLLYQLEKVFPKGSLLRSRISWNIPSGGFFLVLKLPCIVNLEALKVSAEKYGVLWAPMEIFYSPLQVSKEIRLSFSYLTPSEISEGVQRLNKFLKEYLAILPEATIKDNQNFLGDTI